jgi:hypothetical protein
VHVPPTSDVITREQHVRAISKIGESTKSLGETKGFIGEKGIGFKSVFKIANVVHVHSTPYSFRFDTTENAGQGQLGMLAPIWEEIPLLEAPSAQTRIHMELLPHSRVADIYSELSEIDASILLFLQKVKSLKILSPSGLGTSFTRQDRNGIPNTIISRMRTIRLLKSTTETKYNYFVYRFSTPKSLPLPHDSRREGIASSEVVLAFPLKDGYPALASQLVYAFLPLKDFGFRVR